MTVKEESQQKDNISPSADVASKEALPSTGDVATEVSPGDGAQSPPNNKVEDMKGGGEGEEDVGFGPPPAFPSSSKLGKRKRTIMAVSETAAAAAAGGGAPLEDETSSEDGEEGGIKKKASKNSQSIHRGIKEEVKSPVDEEGSRKYSDAMLLASLSDVEGTPKKKGTEFADGNNTTTATTSKVPQVSGGGSSPKAKLLPSSSAPTPQRSNVHAPRPGEPIKPFALLPKQGPGLSASASKSPDARDPKNEKSGAMSYPPYPPQHGYHPSYGYPPTSGYGYPYYGYSSYPPHPYYQPPSHPSAAAPPSTEVPASPEKWGPYHSPKHQDRKTTPAAKGPEKVHSTTAPFHPLSTSSSKISEEGDTTGASFPGPPPMYYDPRYGPPPPPAYNMGPPAGVSRDDGSPPRSSSSNRGPPPSVHTPPRSAPYYDPAAYAPPQPGNPDSPPRSSYPPSSYPGAPPPDPYEQYAYDPTTTSPSASGDAHYHVPASVSNETDHSPNSGKYHQFRKGGRSIHSVPIILRKKFSWRNYPELEEYLIANRTDYLRHSALNYTAEQKHFNNRLTEGLLELAAKLNYVFDETCFNFVAVRDRIRCYYKSYVQSSKKRGVVVGFSRQEDGGLVEKEKIMKC